MRWAAAAERIANKRINAHGTRRLNLLLTQLMQSQNLHSSRQLALLCHLNTHCGANMCLVFAVYPLSFCWLFSSFFFLAFFSAVQWQTSTLNRHSKHTHCACFPIMTHLWLAFWGQTTENCPFLLFSMNFQIKKVAHLWFSINTGANYNFK